MGVGSVPNKPMKKGLQKICGAIVCLGIIYSWLLIPHHHEKGLSSRGFLHCAVCQLGVSHSFIPQDPDSNQLKVFFESETLLSFSEKSPFSDFSSLSDLRAPPSSC